MQRTEILERMVNGWELFSYHGSSAQHDPAATAYKVAIQQGGMHSGGCIRHLTRAQLKGLIAKGLVTVAAPLPGQPSWQKRWTLAPKGVE
jgi:hypothetical protein